MGSVPPLTDNEKLAFWLNAYNEIVRGELSEHPRRGHLFRHRRLFRTVGREVDGLWFTPDVIEHGLLRGNRRPPYGLRPLLRAGDPRLTHAPSVPDPRVHFALNCGARSCPPVRAYEALRVQEQLEEATRAYFAAEATLEPERGVVRLPYLMKLYRADFPDPVGFAQRHLEADLSGLRVAYGGYDWQLG